MSKRQHITKHNPWLLIIPCVLVIWLGWNLYIGHSQAIDMPKQNLLLGGTFDDMDSTGFPAYWNIQAQDDMHYKTSTIEGRYSKAAFSISTSSKGGSDLYIESREIAVKPGEHYFYKGYYKTSVDFDLVVIYHYKNGDTSREVAHSYPYDDNTWSTVSTAVRPLSSVRSVQFAYHTAGNGVLSLDTSYFAAQHDVAELKQPELIGDNLIPDGSFGNPETTFWGPHGQGSLASDFTVVQDSTNFLRTSVTGYKNGEAKWQTQEIATKPFAQYSVSLRYRSTARAQLTVEYIRGDNTRQFATIASLPAASQWTTFRGTFEAPINAQHMVLAATLHSNGTLDTSDYTLFAINSLAKHFKRPLVSVTFDDGWSSDYTEGSRILERFGYRGTFYINPTSIDTKPFMTTQQIQSLKARGHQLASHSYDHDNLTTLSASKINYQLKMAHDYLTELTNTTAIDFASPYGKVDDEVKQPLLHTYSSHRGTEDGVNTLQNFDPYNLRVLFMGSDMPDQTFQEAIQQAKDYDGWLILVYHRINDIPEQANKVSPGNFTKQMQILEDNGMAVRTVRTALQELEPQAVR